MKALSIQQPWAWAVMHAGKDVENRTWATSHRGDIAIHATSQQTSWTLPAGVARPSESELVLRAVIGVVEIVEVVTNSPSRWFTGPRGFVLRNSRPLLRPIPCPGNRNVWELPQAVAQAVHAQLQRAADPSSTSKLGVGARLRKFAKKILHTGPIQPDSQSLRFLTVTQGNLDNNHLYLGPALELFPKDVFGGPNAALAGRSVQVHWNDQVVDTDIVRARIFRRRGWLRRFFALNEIRAGDQVALERIGPYEYRLSKALDHRGPGCHNG